MTHEPIWTTISWMIGVRAIRCRMIRSWVVMRVMLRVRGMVGAWVMMRAWVMVRVWMITRAGMLMRMLVRVLSWFQVFSLSWSIRSWTGEGLGSYDGFCWVEMGPVPTVMVSPTRLLDNDDLRCLRCYLIETTRYSLLDRQLLLWVMSIAN